MFHLKCHPADELGDKCGFESGMKPESRADGKAADLRVKLRGDACRAVES